MTTQEIKVHNVDAKTLFKKDPPSTLREAITYGATLSDFSYGYAEEFILCAIDEICKAHKRQRPLEDDERKELAKRIYRNKKNYTFGDLQLFADMVIDCKLGDALKSVDQASIMEKVREYDKLRRDVEQSIRSNTSSKTNVPRQENLHQVTPDEWEALYRRICLPLTEDQKAFRKEWGEENVRQYGYKLEGKPNTYDERVNKGWWAAWMEQFNSQTETNLPF